MKDRREITKAIEEILERRDEADFPRLIALCWILEPDMDWETARETAQLLLDTSADLPDRKADDAP